MAPNLSSRALALAHSTAVLRLGQDIRARHAEALRAGRYEDALALAPRALQALYRLPPGLDCRGLYCPATGYLLAPRGTTRGGASEAIPGLNLALLECPREVVNLTAAQAGQQLRAVELLCATAAWLAGACVASRPWLEGAAALEGLAPPPATVGGYSRSSAVWFAPEEVAAVLPAAVALAREDQLDSPRWRALLVLARQLAAHYRHLRGADHGCTARIGWAVRAAQRAQYDRREDDQRLAAK